MKLIIILKMKTKEFTKMLSHPHIINIDFVEDKAGKMVRNSMYVKQARGKMLDLMVKNKISDLDSLKRLTFDGYIYHEELSTDDNYVYIRNGKQTYKKL